MVCKCEREQLKTNVFVVRGLLCKSCLALMEKTRVEDVLRIEKENREKRIIEKMREIAQREIDAEEAG